VAREWAPNLPKLRVAAGAEAIYQSSSRTSRTPLDVPQKRRPRQVVAMLAEAWSQLCVGAEQGVPAKRGAPSEPEVTRFATFLRACEGLIVPVLQLLWPRAQEQSLQRGSLTGNRDVASSRVFNAR